MANRAPSGLPDPGWYLDPGSGRRRWWNGIAWTNQLDGDHALGALVQPNISSTTSVTPWPIWTIVLLPFVVLMPTLTVDFTSYFREVLAAVDSGNAGAIPLPLGVVAMQILSFAIYPATVVLAFLDWRTLRRRGVLRPFHWAWAFLSIIYVIGRSVVLRRRVGRGSAPLWIYLLVSVLAGAVEGAVIANALVTVILEQVPAT